MTRALHSVAGEEGRAAGTYAASNLRPRAPDKLVEAAVLDVVTADGYEPCRDGGDIALANCPFRVLAREETELVCGMNFA